MFVILWDEVNKDIANKQADNLAKLLSKLAKEQMEKKWRTK